MPLSMIVHMLSLDGLRSFENENVPHLSGDSGSSPSNRVSLAAALFCDGNFELAWYELSSALAENPELADGQVVKGIMLACCKEYSQAVIPLTLAVELDPETDMPYLVLARIYEKLNQPQSALDTIAKLVKIQPSHASALAFQATLLKGLGRVDEALAAWQQASQTSRPEAKYHLEVARIHGTAGRWSEAITELDRAYCLSPKSPEILTEKVDALRAVGQTDAAAELCRVGLSNSPLHAPLYHRLACWFWEKQSPSAAMGLLRSAVQLDPNMSEAHELLAEIYQSFDWTIEAQKCDARVNCLPAPVAPGVA